MIQHAHDSADSSARRSQGLSKDRLTTSDFGPPLVSLQRSCTVRTGPPREPRTLAGTRELGGCKPPTVRGIDSTHGINSSIYAASLSRLAIHADVSQWHPTSQTLYVRNPLTWLLDVPSTTCCSPVQANQSSSLQSSDRYSPSLCSIGRNARNASAREKATGSL